MPESIGPLSHFAAAVAVCAIGGLIRGFSGFGGGLVLTPLLSLLYGPAVAVPVSVLVNLLVNVQLMPSSLSATRWRVSLPVGTVSCLTAPLGVWLLAVADAETIRRAIGIAVLGFTVIIASGWSPAPKGGALPDTVVGIMGGLLNGAAAIGGAPITLYILGREGIAASKRADLIMIFAIMHVATVASFHAAGLLTGKAVWLSVLLLPVFMLASWAGTTMFRRSDNRTYDRVAQIFLIIVGLAAVLK